MSHFGYIGHHLIVAIIDHIPSVFLHYIIFIRFFRVLQTHVLNFYFFPELSSVPQIFFTMDVPLICTSFPNPE